MLPISVGQTLRFFNFRTKFLKDQSKKNLYKIYLAVDKFGNVVEEKTEKVQSLNTKYNISEEIWEPDNEESKTKNWLKIIASYFFY